MLHFRTRNEGLLAVTLIALPLFAFPARADLAPRPPTASPVTVTAASGATSGEASVAVGERLVVRLPGSAGTGYSWKLEGDAGPELALVDQRIEAKTGRVLGGAQMQAFEFEANAVGEKELTFNYGGPGASDETAPAKIYVLTVSVSE